MQQLLIYNTLSHQKELFKPITPDHVGMYVCGPTVYGDGHLGHARPAITFDVLYRYLTHLGYKVRYVRNITDVGHLEHDADEGEDKIAKKARLEQLEPMEVAQYYTNRYHAAMDALNVLRPSIEPLASGHVMEQIELVQKILDAGFAYVSNGSVYFDVRKYHEHFKSYGRLSGRVIDEMLSTTRELDGQSEKHDTADTPSKLIRMLTDLFDERLDGVEKVNRLRDEYGLKLTRNVESEVTEMCSYATAMENKGIEKGIEKGLKALVTSLKDYIGDYSDYDEYDEG